MKYLQQFFLVVILGLFSIGTLVAQNDFSKVFYYPFESVLSSSVVATYDDCFMISGSRDEQNSIIKIDIAANIIWNRNFGLTNSSLSNMIISLYDSTFLFVTSNYSAAAGNSIVLCVNFNIDGDTIWTSSIDLGGWVNVYSVNQTLDSGCIISANVGNTGSPYSKIAIIKLDYLGNIQWSGLYSGGNLSNTPSAVKQTADTGYVIVGTVYHQTPYYHDAFIMKLESTGEVQWAYTYKTASANTSSGNDIYVDDSGFLMSLVSFGLLNVIKTDFDGNILWSKRYMSAYAEEFYGIPKKRIVKTVNDSYVLLSGDNLIGIDEVGIMLWSTFFYMYVSDFTPTPDNGYLIIGNGPIIGVKSSITGDPQIGLVKTDSMGFTSGFCSEPYSTSQFDVEITRDTVSFTLENSGVGISTAIEFTTSLITSEDACVAFVGSTDENIRQDKFQISPNPSNGTFSIVSLYGNKEGTIRVFDLHGNEILRADLVDINWIVNINDQPKGCYYMEIHTNNNVEVHKVMVF